MSDVSRVEEVFLAAAELPDPALRATYLDEACAGDEDFRRRVETLLAAQPQLGRFLENPEHAEHAADGPARRKKAPVSATVGERVGPYRLLERIGEGGMGEVWVADQLEPIKRRVALKLIKPGMDSRSVLGRFEAERQALAVMDHPNIARVLDAGTTKDGRPYFVMELVKGTPITEFADARKLTPQQRLELFIPVCLAIQHAHMKGIIHRDIKPSNVLVALHDETPVPKVIDFGVAKAIGQQLTENTIYTGFGALVGTPAYMAPEQATFNQLDIDTRADIYALGVLLYELLAGSPPIEKERLKKAALDEVLRIVRDEEPPRPSSRLSTSQAKASIAATRGSEVTKLAAIISGELDWIVMKALEKDRTRRYETANGFAADIQRYLAGEQVQAVPPSLGYRLRKAYRRNKAAVLVGSAFAGLILGAAAMGFILAMQARQAELVAENKRTEAEVNADRANEAMQKAIDAQSEANQQRNAALLTTYATSMNLAARAWAENNVPLTRELLESMPGSVAGEDIRGFEWQYLSRVSNSALRTFDGHSGSVICIAFSPDGNLVATGSSDRTVKVWSAETGNELFTTEEMSSGPVLGVAWSADGKRIAGCGASETFVWDSHTGERMLALKGHKHFVTEILYSPDGSQIATASYDGLVKVWDSATGHELMSFNHSGDMGHDGYLFTLAYSPDGRRLASAGLSQTIKVWDLRERRENVTIKGHRNTIWSVAFSPDGMHLASASSDKTVRIWDSSRGDLIMTIPSRTDDVYSVAYSGDGRRLAGGGEKRTIKIWDPDTGEELTSIKGHGDPVRCVTFSRDGLRLASGANDRTAKIWNANIHNEPLTLEDFGPVAFARNGQHVATRGSTQTTITVWDRLGRNVPINLNGHTTTVDRLAISPDGRYVASVSVSDGAKNLEHFIKVWSTNTASELFSLESQEGPYAEFAFSSDSQYLATTSSYGMEVSIWDVSTGLQISRLDTGAQQAHALVYSPAGKQLVTVHEFWGDKAQIWDVENQKCVFNLEGHSEPVSGTAYSPDGQRLATASRDKTVKVWDTTTGLELYSLKGHTEGVLSVAFHPDGRRLATSSLDGTVKLWDSENGQELASLNDVRSALSETASRGSVVSFSPDGDCLISQHQDGRVNIWNRTSETPIWCQQHLEQSRGEPATTCQMMRRASILWSVGRKVESRTLYRKWIAVEVDPTALNRVAMNYAVNNNPGDRDGALAIEAATKACELTGYSKPHIVDTLASAYAEKGEFDAAVTWQLKAIELLKEGADRRLYEENLRLFREKKTASPDVEAHP